MISKHGARKAALQALYFCHVSGAAPSDALETVFAEHAPTESDSARAFATAMVEGVVADAKALDQLIEEHANNWRIERLALLDRLILRMAVWELQHERDTPVAVVMNEALELARTFSTPDSVRFVNGVLDAIRGKLERQA